MNSQASPNRPARRDRQLLRLLQAHRRALAWGLYALGLAAFLLLPLASRDVRPDEKGLLFSGLPPAVRSSPWQQRALEAYAQLLGNHWESVPALLRSAAAALPAGSSRQPLEVHATQTRVADSSNCSSAHVVARALRGNGVETLAIVLPVDPWGQPGLTALAASIGVAAARHLETLPWMAKDVVLVLVDSRCSPVGVAGAVQAWLEGYTRPADPASAAGGGPGALQQAVVLELLPLGSSAARQARAKLTVHGWDGQLPNLDMTYLMQRNWELHAGIPLVGLGGQPDLSDAAGRLGAWLDAVVGPGGGRAGWNGWSGWGGSWGQRYAGELLTSAAFALQQAVGSPGGAHAAFLQAGIDSATVTLSSSAGTAGTAGAMEQLVTGACLSFIEGVTRTLGGLEERLHHASQLYLLVGPGRVVPLAAYLAAPACLLLALLLQFSVELGSSLPAAHPAWRRGWAAAAASHAAAMLLCCGAAAWRLWKLRLAPANPLTGSAEGWRLAFLSFPAPESGDAAAAAWAWVQTGVALAVGAACLWGWAAALQQSLDVTEPTGARQQVAEEQQQPQSLTAAQSAAAEATGEAGACLRATAAGCLTVVALGLVLGHWVLCYALLLAGLPCLLATQRSRTQRGGGGKGKSSSSSGICENGDGSNDLCVEGGGRLMRIAKLLLGAAPAALVVWGASCALGPATMGTEGGFQPALVLAVSELSACLLAACLSCFLW